MSTPKEPILKSKVGLQSQIRSARGPFVGGIVAIIGILSFSYPFFYVRKVLPQMTNDKEVNAKKNSRGAYLNSGNIIEE